MGRIGWILSVSGALLLLPLAALVWVYFTSPVALLGGVDRIAGGTGGARLLRTDLAYGADPAQRLDIYAPSVPSRAPAPVLVFIYGGSWNSGVPAQYHFIGRTFARAGYVVVLPGYRRVPAGRFPHMLEDSAAAVRWVHDHIAEFGGDPARVFLAGHSAGAYNVMMLALERQWLGRQGLDDRAVRGVIGLSGPYDFFPFTTDAARAAFAHEPDPALTQPITFARAEGPPLLLLTGDRDTTVKPRNSFALAKAITALGTPTSVTVIPGASHGDTVKLLARPFSNDRRVLDAVLSFMAAHGGPSAPVQKPGG